VAGLVDSVLLKTFPSRLTTPATRAGVSLLHWTGPCGRGFPWSAMMRGFGAGPTA